MTTNVGNLPSEATSLIQQLNGLREQQKALMSEVGRLQDRRAASITQLSLVKKSTEQQKEDAAENLTDPKTTLAWSQLVTRKASLEGELTRLKQELREKHPDVIAKQKEIDQVKADMDDMVAEWKEKIKEKEQKLADRPDLASSGLEAEIKMVEGEINATARTCLRKTKNRSLLIIERINNVPGAEVHLGVIERDYQTKKAAYDQLLQQQRGITLNADAASQQQGESIEVVDPANLPSQSLLLQSASLLVGHRCGCGTRAWTTAYRNL